MSMKKEDLIYSMADIDDSFIEEADPEKAGIRAVENQASKKVTSVRRSLSKTAVAAIVAVLGVDEKVSVIINGKTYK